MLGHTCDEIQDLWYMSDNTDRYKCSELESAYGCDCSNCACTYDETTSTTVPTTTPGCQSSCVGGVDCDSVLSYYFNVLDTVLSCDVLENDISGCDCTGCECVDNTPPTTTAASCTDSCGGFNCDDWDSFLGGGDFSCAVMESTYGCDCSGCDCVGGHGECLAATFDGVDLCQIGSTEMTCDEWANYDFGGESLTCQYLEFYFGCDCSSCQCATEPNCGADGVGTVRE